MAKQPAIAKPVSWSSLAAALGVERNTLAQWRKRPDAPKSREAAEWEAYAEKNGLGSSGADSDRIGRELRHEKARHEIELLKAKVDREARRVVPRDEVNALLLHIGTRLRTMLYQYLETEAPPKLDGMGAAQMRPILVEMADSILGAASDIVKEFNDGR